MFVGKDIESSVTVTRIIRNGKFSEFWALLHKIPEQIVFIFCRPCSCVDVPTISQLRSSNRDTSSGGSRSFITGWGGAQ